MDYGNNEANTTGSSFADTFVKKRTSLPLSTLSGTTPYTNHFGLMVSGPNGLVVHKFEVAHHATATRCYVENVDGTTD